MLIAAAQHAVALTRDLIDGEITLHAMSLVYTSLLSLVPLLALAFSLLKALGLHNNLQPLLLQFFAPLGAQAPELARSVVGFVNNMQVGVLGSVGVALLLYTSISMIHKVETSFNFLWNIPAARSLPQRLGEYLAMMIIGPTAVFLALGLTNSAINSALAERLQGIEPFGLALALFGRLIPYWLMIAALTFVYVYVPNTRVRFRAAGIAGIVAGIAWQAASAVFASFVSRATNYNAVYSGFAIVIFVLIWLYVSWLIVLLGCRLSFYLQNPRQLLVHRKPLAGSREFEGIALEVVAIAGRRFLRAEPAPTRRDLQRELGVPDFYVERAVAALIANGILIQSGEGLFPACDLAALTIAELWRRVRGDWPQQFASGLLALKVQQLLQSLERREDGWEQRSVRDWLLQES